MCRNGRMHSSALQLTPAHISLQSGAWTWVRVQYILKFQSYFEIPFWKFSHFTHASARRISTMARVDAALGDRHSCQIYSAPTRCGLDVFSGEGEVRGGHSKRVLRLQQACFSPIDIGVHLWWGKLQAQFRSMSTSATSFWVLSGRSKDFDTWHTSSAFLMLSWIKTIGEVFLTDGLLAYQAPVLTRQPGSSQNISHKKAWSRR